MKERERVRKKEREGEEGGRRQGGRDRDREAGRDEERGEGIMNKFFPHCFLYHVDYSETWKFMQPPGSHAQVAAISCACYAAVASLGHVALPPTPLYP